MGSVKPLVSLLVKTLLDARTLTAHRRNVASVVIRLLYSSNDTTANDSMVCKRRQSLVATNACNGTTASLETRR